MTTIDLSKAKVGDKFRTRCGQIVRYVGEDQDKCIGNDKFLFDDKEGYRYHFYEDGTYMNFEGHELDLVEQVFDKTLDIIERYERINRDMQKIAEIADEERQELQRRKEVIELARKMLFDDNTYQFYINYIRAKQNEGAEQVMTYLRYVIDYAEDCVNKFNQYLNDGKLC